MAKISEVPAQVEETVGKTIEATVTSLKAGVAKATANYEATQAQVKQGVEKAVSTAEELVAFNQANLEAIVRREGRRQAELASGFRLDRDLME